MNPVHRLFRRCHLLTSGSLGSCQQHDGDAEFTRRNELRLRGAATGIFGNEHIDGMITHQHLFQFHRKRRAGSDPLGIGNGRVFHRIDTAHHEKMRRMRVSVNFQSPHRQENALRQITQQSYNFLMSFDFAPFITSSSAPCGPDQRQDRHVRLSRSSSGIKWHAPRKRMCRIHNGVNVVFSNPISKPVHTPKPAYAAINVWQHGIFSASRQRKCGADILLLRNRRNKLASLRSSTQNEYMHG